MAETPPKRQREETHDDFSEENQDPKRPKSYDQILSLLELEEEQEQEPNQDFSSILTTLQQELDPFSVPGSDFEPDRDNMTRLEGEERDETERFMRHLLEASDDELGLPNRVDGGGGGGESGEGINGGDELLFCDGLWDLEDDAANYFSLLQSELFM
ncbi:hypothetical protein Vadar_020078 [Vaccinium darrowii]|uniref:Uncharacterized protein n=1 Tax=Vaccinium darrowii TaxID=229202 RepID=A0ACB7X2C3_9ERIC|nr:hypothetical protein Vadar_020078 [Vaccinium darrowii]